MKKVKDYYDVLSLDKNVKKKEIEAKVADRSKNSPLTKLEREAAGTLMDPVTRTKYDEELESYNQNVAKRNEIIKKYHIKGLCGVLCGVALVGTISGVALSNKGNCHSNGYGNQPKATSTPTPKPTATPTPTATPKPTDKPLPTPTPIVAEKVEVLDNANIGIVAEQLAEGYGKKGLEVNAKDVKSALIISSYGNIDEDEMEKILSRTNKANEFDKASVFATCITSHNIGNCLYGGKVSNYVCVSDLIYNNPTDKKIIGHLDELSIWLLKSMENKTLTNKQYNTSLNAIVKFYEEKACLEIDGEEYWYYDLSASGRFLSQMGIWPTLFNAYVINEHATLENQIDLTSVNTKCIDGLDYVNEFNDTACAKVPVKKQ